MAQSATGVRLPPIVVAASAASIERREYSRGKWPAAARKAAADSLEAGRRRWAANRPARYRFAAYIKCGFCGGGGFIGAPRGSAVALRVLDREVTGMDFMYPTVPVTGYPQWMFVPVDSLFPIVEREIVDTNRRVDGLKLDPVFGFPRAWETDGNSGQWVTDQGYWATVAIFAPADSAAPCGWLGNLFGKCLSDAFEPRTRHTVDRMAQKSPSSQVPLFPRELWVGDKEVRVRYVIDTAGHVVIGSQSIVPPAVDGFSASVKGIATEFLFAPARLHGRAVSVRAEEVFVFRSFGIPGDSLEALDALTEDPADVVHDTAPDGVPRTFLIVQHRAASPDARFSPEELLRAQQAAISSVVRDGKGAPTVTVSTLQPWATDEVRAWGSITRGTNTQRFGCIVLRDKDGWWAQCAHTER